VIPWRTAPLALDDLARVRLVGCSKRVPLPRVVEVGRESLSCHAHTAATLTFDSLTTRTAVSMPALSFLLFLCVCLQAYVSVLDLEADTLKSPPYTQGTYVDRILGTGRFLVRSFPPLPVAHAPARRVTSVGRERVRRSVAGRPCHVPNSVAS
jgi:hypothetical protein